MQTYAVLLGYKGSAFSGFARQPGQLTVQGSLEEALSLIFRYPVQTVCAGRTDAGVHARGQVISFDLDQACMEGRSKEKILRSLRALTHDDIVIHDWFEVPQGFSARFDAVMREYHYHIYPHLEAPLFMRDFSWHTRCSLDVEAMSQAAQYFIGEHDFKSFCLAASAVGKPTHRYVEEVSLYTETLLGEEVLTIKVRGNAFLHSMVRTMVGSLVMVGKGQRTPEWIAEVLAACDRCAAGENAPAQGLVFWQVEYDCEAYSAACEL